MRWLEKLGFVLLIAVLGGTIVTKIEGTNHLFSMQHYIGYIVSVILILFPYSFFE